MNLDKLITEWLNEYAVADKEHLKSRKQELVEGIGRIIDGTKVDVVSEFGTSRRDAYGFKKEILRKLTGK